MPDLAHLPLRRIGAEGTDNVLYRLGHDLLVRFPRLPHAAAQVDSIARWLPDIAARLPLAVPLVLRLGQPDHGYHFPWMVTAWLPGRTLGVGLDQPDAARRLAGMIRALQTSPAPIKAPLRRGDAINLRLAGVAAQIPEVIEGDARQLRGLLDRLSHLPPPKGPPVWSHGDLHSLNLLMRRGRLSAVIDWGSLGMGDPAMDLLPAFMVFDPPARDIFLAELSPEPPAVERARAVALSKVVRGLPYYRTSNPGLHAVLCATLPRLFLP